MGNLHWPLPFPCEARVRHSIAGNLSGREDLLTFVSNLYSQQEFLLFWRSTCSASEQRHEALVPAVHPCQSSFIVTGRHVNDMGRSRCHRHSLMFSQVSHSSWANRLWLCSAWPLDACNAAPLIHIPRNLGPNHKNVEHVDLLACLQAYTRQSPHESTFHMEL